MKTPPFDWTPEMLAQRDWDRAHTNAKGEVQYPNVEVSEPYHQPPGYFKNFYTTLDGIRERRLQRDGPFLKKVEGAKILPWLFKYRIGQPGKRKGWVSVLWCPKRHSGERLLMRLQDKFNPFAKKPKARSIDLGETE